jgi:hypothetical protein
VSPLLAPTILKVAPRFWENLWTAALEKQVRKCTHTTTITASPPPLYKDSHSTEFDGN